MGGDAVTVRHGVIGLIPERCTSCMLCVRECPVWCIELTAHPEVDPATPAGGRARTINVLDTFSIDYGLCMYCGICVEVCPFDALEWVADSNTVESQRDSTVQDRTRLAAWLPDR